MYFRQILHEGRSCLSYLIGCVSYGVCAVVDAQDNPITYIQQAAKQGLKITAVFETHIQADHLSTSKELADKVGAELYFGPDAHVTFPHHSLVDGYRLTIGNRTIHVLHTPGHTPEHITLYVDEWFLLTGDVLFVGDVGRVDLGLNDSTEHEIQEKASRLFQSIQKLLLLPEWTEIFPGHFAGSVCGKGMDGKMSSTLGREKRKNHALRLTKNDFIKYLTENALPQPKDFRMNKIHNSGGDELYR